MKIELTQTLLQSPQKIGELASHLDSIHTRVLKTIDRLQKDVEARRTEIANRWKNAGISSQDKARYAEHETASVIVDIQRNASAEMNRFYKEAGPVHAQLVAQRPYYDSPVKVLSRAGLGTPQRTDYLHQLAYAGPGELGHMAQVAVGTKNVPLAAALVSLLDSKPTKERPVSSVALASAMDLEDYNKVQEYFKIGDARLQSTLIAIRSWMAGKGNPINTISLALRNQDIDYSVLVDGDA